jgi:hypothetical protein
MNDSSFTWARKCPVCGRLITVMRSGMFMIHGPKKARCAGSHKRYDEAAPTHAAGEHEPAAGSGRAEPEEMKR